MINPRSFTLHGMGFTARNLALHGWVSEDIIYPQNRSGGGAIPIKGALRIYHNLDDQDIEDILTLYSFLWH